MILRTSANSWKAIAEITQNKGLLLERKFAILFEVMRDTKKTKIFSLTCLRDAVELFNRAIDIDRSGKDIDPEFAIVDDAAYALRQVRKRKKNDKNDLSTGVRFFIQGVWKDGDSCTKEYNWVTKAKHESKKFRDQPTPLGWLQHLAKNFKQMCVRGENNEDRCDHNFFVLVIK